MSTPRYITATKVAELTTLAERTVYARQDGRDGFPRPVRVAGRRLAWIESEVLEWLKSRPRSDTPPASERVA